MKNKKDVAVMLKEAAILAVITLLAGLLLGFIYELTKEPILVQQEKAVQDACKAVFPEAEKQGIAFNDMSYVISDDLAKRLAQNGVVIGTVYEAVASDNSLKGYVVQTTSTEGYGGKIVLYVGVTVEGKLNDISILDISETPGLGMQAEKVLVPQFHDKNVEQFTYTKTGSQSESEIDAISGATITTKAVTNAVNGALETVHEVMAK